MFVEKQRRAQNFKEKGATLIEYAVLAGLIVVVALASLEIIGTTISTQFSMIGDSL